MVQSLVYDFFLFFLFFLFEQDVKAYLHILKMDLSIFQNFFCLLRWIGLYAFGLINRMFASLPLRITQITFLQLNGPILFLHFDLELKAICE